MVRPIAVMKTILSHANLIDCVEPKLAVLVAAALLTVVCQAISQNI
jgi:hypothetical protein